MEAITVKAKIKVQNDIVVLGTRKGNAVVVGSMSSKTIKQKEKEVLMISYPVFVHILIIHIDAQYGRPDCRG